MLVISFEIYLNLVIFILLGFFGYTPMVAHNFNILESPCDFLNILHESKEIFENSLKKRFSLCYNKKHE